MRVVSALKLHPVQEEENGNIPCCLKLWQPEGEASQF